MLYSNSCITCRCYQSSISLTSSHWFQFLGFFLISQGVKTMLRSILNPARVVGTIPHFEFCKLLHVMAHRNTN